MPTPEPARDTKAEIEALTGIVKALDPLTKDQRERILRYVRDFFGLYIGEA